MTFILATNNAKKLLELREILSDLGLDVVSLKEAGFDSDVEETGDTFVDNALLKATEACRVSGMPAIADDSGLVVAALGSAPGVRSARYGGDGLSDADRTELLLKNMRGMEQRDAKFVSSIACVFPNGDILTAEGECRGEITQTPSGSGGFGYDPVFFLKEAGKTLAEMSPEEKHAVSHRGHALRELKRRLENYLTAR